MNFVSSSVQEDYTDDSHVSLFRIHRKKEEGRGKRRKKVTFHDFDDRLCLKEKMIESPSFFDPLLIIIMSSLDFLSLLCLNPLPQYG